MRRDPQPRPDPGADPAELRGRRRAEVLHAVRRERALGRAAVLHHDPGEPVRQLQLPVHQPTFISLDPTRPCRPASRSAASASASTALMAPAGQATPRSHATVGGRTTPPRTGSCCPTSARSSPCSSARAGPVLPVVRSARLPRARVSRSARQRDAAAAAHCGTAGLRHRHLRAGQPYAVERDRRADHRPGVSSLYNASQQSMPAGAADRSIRLRAADRDLAAGRRLLQRADRQPVTARHVLRQQRAWTPASAAPPPRSSAPAAARIGS